MAVKLLTYMYINRQK